MNFLVGFGSSIFEFQPDFFPNTPANNTLTGGFSRSLVQVIKYVLYLHLCGGGCVSNILGIGPRFTSMSLLLSNISALSNEY